jgi:hypothetical protein
LLVENVAFEIISIFTKTNGIRKFSLLSKKSPSKEEGKMKKRALELEAQHVKALN